MFKVINKYTGETFADSFGDYATAVALIQSQPYAVRVMLVVRPE